jgi:hypothetical protein
MITTRTREEISSHFFVGISEDWKEKVILLKEKVPLCFHDDIDSFVFNLSRSMSAGKLPFDMASYSVHSRNFQRLMSAESIRQLVNVKKGEALGPSEIAAAKAIADRRMEEFLRDTDEMGFPIIASEILQELDSFLNSEQFKDAAFDILLQTISSTWSTLEVFMNDLLITSINENPQIGIRMISTHPSKKYFSGSIQIESLFQFDFDLRNKLGNALLGEKNINSLDAIRDIFSTVAHEKSGLHKALADPTLRRLWKARNLIAHRRGIVDEFYVSQTGDKAQTIGQRLKTNRRDLEIFSSAVITAAKEIVCALPLR